MVGERSVCLRRWTVRTAGGIRSENAGTSNDKTCDTVLIEFYNKRRQKKSAGARIKKAGIDFHQGGNSAHEHETEESSTDYSFQEGRQKNDTGFPNVMAVESNIGLAVSDRQQNRLVKQLI